MNNLYKNFFVFSLLTLIFLLSSCTQPTAVKGEKGDTGASGVADGDTAWHEVGATGQPPFLTTWANVASYSTCAFRKDGDGFVHLKGVVNGGSASTTIFYLPTGYRPGHELFVGNTTAYLNIGTNGAVFENATTIYLDGVSFYAEQ